MKRFVFLLGCLLSSVLAVQAQNAAVPATEADNAAAREATEKLVLKYSLDPAQAKQMYTIQARKQRNLAQIESFKTSDPSMYRAKMQSQQKGTLNSIRRLLTTKEQVQAYEKTQVDVRSARAEKRKELVAAKASKDVIEAAMLELYAE